ncbi:hypothetical protein J4461_00430 [Candidatus Pacearchaeota archaeon]|nr:hypothetical protein [Candidatus Pacearchaeota archaeon]
MIINRKGLSDVVTTVLIILLVIVAIGAIWAFVQKPFKTTETQFNRFDACVDVDIQPQNCSIGSTNYEVIVKTNKKGNVQALKVLFEKSDGTVESETAVGTIPEQYNTQKVTVLKASVTTTSTNTVKKVSIIPVVQGEGTTFDCAETARITCA